ncbi:hypothetical protein RF240_22265, partial [Dickeya dadantii]|uniref:hypothetical protein n=1 Tax=Dickeya dadantii TaxID=204038 RepID=UPI0035A8EB22
MPRKLVSRLTKTPEAFLNSVYAGPQGEPQYVASKRVTGGPNSEGERRRDREAAHHFATQNGTALALARKGEPVRVHNLAL